MFRKTILISIFWFFIGFYVAAQETTQEEYNYVTKGYKVQVESGLDMKKGYRLDNLLEQPVAFENGQIRRCVFKALYKDGEAKPSAIMCVYTRADTAL